MKRIQNPALYRQFKSRKQDMDSVNGTTTNNESRLWHGTGKENVGNINSRNFNRSFCGQHGIVIFSLKFYTEVKLY